MANTNPHKPSKNHPWRKAPSSEVCSWAQRESYVRDVSNVNVARSETLQRKRTVVIPSR